MKRIFSFLMFMLITLGLSSEELKPSTAQSKSGSLAVIGGTIIDGTGPSLIKNGIILIENNKIVEVGEKDRTVIPKNARRIDATGKYIIPGLLDANVHLVLGGSIDFFARHERRFEDLVEEAAQITLKNGVTTVFDTWGPLQPLLNVREKINRGEAEGSRIYLAGTIVGFSGPFAVDFFGDPGPFVTKAFVKRINAMWEENVGPELGYLTPDQVRGEIHEYISRGIDFLKYAASGHSFNGMKNLIFSGDVQRAIIEEAHSAGITVQAHTTSNESLRTAVEAGVDLVTHADVTGPVAITDSTLILIKKRQVPCGILPTTQSRQKAEKQNAHFLPFDPKFLEAWRENSVKLINAGIPVLSSTDGFIADTDTKLQYAASSLDDDAQTLDGGLFLRCQALVELGMAPMDAILTATRNIASAYGKLQELGTLEKGKLADLLVLDSNPLDDIRNLRKIFLIIKGGRIVEREKLPVRKILTQ